MSLAVALILNADQYVGCCDMPGHQQLSDTKVSISMGLSTGASGANWYLCRVAQRVHWCGIPVYLLEQGMGGLVHVGVDVAQVPNPLDVRGDMGQFVKLGGVTAAPPIHPLHCVSELDDGSIQLHQVLLGEA